MKIGVCCGCDVGRMKIAKAIGFDYVETNCRGIADADDALIAEMKAAGIPILAANGFIGLRVVGPSRDGRAIEEYLERLFRRASELGIKTLVFGSANARLRKPEEGLTEDECRAQIVDFLKNAVAPSALRHGIVIAVEPLRPGECNLINSIAQGVEIAKRTDSPNVRALADVAHMVVQDEPMSEIRKYADWLVHAHTSSGFGDEKYKRLYPAKGDRLNQDDFILPLIDAGVETCSIEAGFVDFESDAREAFEVLKKYRGPDSAVEGS